VHCNTIRTQDELQKGTLTTQVECQTAIIIRTHRAGGLSQRVDSAMEQAIHEIRLVGVVVPISRDGDLIHRRVAGFADREARRPIREDTIVRLVSLKKPIVTAAAMALATVRTIRVLPIHRMARNV
jgi:CubicO group peptidase (beta-lactamase class C family)